MLVLTRRSGEEIVIGRDIRLTVLGIRGNRVQLGLVGPAGVPIHRQEVQEAIFRGPPALGSAECA
jgi:carbon storage regulator